MFRPNRIGTPIIHTSAIVTSTVDWTPVQHPINGTTFQGNVIAATPALDFGRASLSWTGTEVLTALNRIMLLFPFTVTKPLVGDTVGLECNASIIMNLAAGQTITPVVGVLTGAPTTLLQGSTILNGPTYIGPPKIEAVTGATGVQRGYQYKEQVIFNASPFLGYPMAHGFMISDNLNAAWTLTNFHMVASIRQLNDQQTIGYRDTLR